MMAANSATTLVTFLVRAPPNVRSVKLLGSWDNFSREYGMEKDTRMGGGYWKGCHTFTNIICDGQVKNTPRQGRHGALKMGGTYWYHYRLDDDVDFYNKDESSTTSCPFLPGQPVNVLNVPINLPSVDTYHRRGGSGASVTSINQTMNPEDKYMNPRPPPRPELPRLTTSPSPSVPFHYGPSTSPVTPPKHPFHERRSSHPRETLPRRKFRPGNKSSPDLCASANSQSKSNPFRTAFRNLASPRFGGKVSDWGKVESADDLSALDSGAAAKSRKEGNYRCLEVDTAPQPREQEQLCSSCSSPLRSPMGTSMPSRYDLRGRPDGNALGPFPPRDESRQRNKNNPSREPQKRAEPNQPTTTQPKKAVDSGSACLGAADVADHFGKDPNRFTITCKLDVGKNGTPAPVDLNLKRLPTLPNSPSSVLEETFATKNCDGPDRNFLQSRFSESTAPSTRSSPDITEYPGGSHFSELTTADSDAMSPSSMTSATTFNNDSETEQHYFRRVGHPHASCGPSAEQPLQSTAKQVPNASEVPRVYRDTITEHNQATAQPPVYYDHDLEVPGLYITRPCSTDSSHRTPQSHFQDHDLSPSSLTQPHHDVPSPSFHHYPEQSRDYDYNYQTQKSTAASFQTPRVDFCQNSHSKNIDARGMMQEMFDEMSYLANEIQSHGDGVEYHH